jgi:hypothetical protein
MIARPLGGFKQICAAERNREHQERAVRAEPFAFSLGSLGAQAASFCGQLRKSAGTLSPAQRRDTVKGFAERDSGLRTIVAKKANKVAHGSPGGGLSSSAKSLTDSRFVYLQLFFHKRSFVQHGNGFLGLPSRRHLNEVETPGCSGLMIFHDFDGNDVPGLGKKRFEIGLGSLRR